LLLLALGLAGCTTLDRNPAAARAPRPADPAPALRHTPIELSLFKLEPGPRTVESNMLLRLYTWFHANNYDAYRIEFPSDTGGAPATAHWLVPKAKGPHPTIIVFPILDGSHVISELLAKALANQGLAVARLERRPLRLEEAQGPEELEENLGGAVRDARRLLDFLETRPEVDRARFGVAGISLGGVLACLLASVDPRVRGSFFMLTGGGLAEIVYDSSEKPVRRFRDRMLERLGTTDRDAFLEWLRPYTEPVEPLRYARALDPRNVYLASGRFDRVMRPDRTRALWEALGQPEWTRLPVGHYQGLPFLFWTVSRAVEHLDRVFAGVTTVTDHPGNAADLRRDSRGRSNARGSPSPSRDRRTSALARINRTEYR
jgi:poly(3-hydroxybutyrate) depolymerase